ncbi:ribonucleotide reductase small subunit [Rhodocollybia butyracea]|uniref:Ribonucleotide reductase small subunit n=1 Tax=Rhodocollybia butyracea TaxID=206335 RepID=A0A9P5P5V8_9AGAR|nr:ribonucleotide reductase small subunit [Rhodocollybia butyracea]
MVSMFDSPTTRDLSSRISKGIQIQEARSYYGFRNMRSSIHLEAYSDYLKPQSNNPSPSLQTKMSWIQRQIVEPGTRFSKLLLVDALVRGVFCAGTLAAIEWTTREDPSANISSAFLEITRDLHQDVMFNSLVFSYLCRRIHPCSLADIVKEAVTIEQDFVKGLDVNLINQHIEFAADRLIIGFGGTAIYNSATVFSFKPLESSNNAKAQVGVEKPTSSLSTASLVFDEDF